MGQTERFHGCLMGTLEADCINDTNRPSADATHFNRLTGGPDSTKTKRHAKIASSAIKTRRSAAFRPLLTWTEGRSYSPSTALVAPCAAQSPRPVVMQHCCREKMRLLHLEYLRNEE
ncbi:hypothetical protein PRIPAC_86587, partial [Pristionchus pacificus]|uniref:Uncharacterized protein n=1 Tax=Pristionchus pacificus TaxID=54126 RepID=A0A2A6BLL6_PRIPA